MLKEQGDDADILSRKRNNTEAGRRLRQARNAAKLSQEELAERLGVSPDSVARWEKGISRPRPYALRRLYEVFGKDAEMFGFEESEEQKSPEARAPENEDLRVSREKISDQLPRRNLLIGKCSVSRRDILIASGGVLALTVGYTGFAKWFQLWPLSLFLSKAVRYYYKAPTRGLSWSPDGAYLASAHEDRFVLVWSKKTGDSVAYKGHIQGNGFANAVAWCPTGKYIASVNGGVSPSVRVWSFPLTNTDLFVQKRDMPLTTVAWSHNGKYLAFAGRGSKVEIWEPLVEKQISQFDLPGITGIQDLSWSQDDTVIAVATNDKAIFFCDRLHFTFRAITDAHTGTIEAIAWSPTSPVLLASGSTDGTVKIWDVSSNVVQFTYRGHLKAVTSIDWSPDGNLIVSASTDGTVHQWEVATGNLREKYSDAKGDELYALDLSSNGKQLAFAGKEKNIYVWNVQ